MHNLFCSVHTYTPVNTSIWLIRMHTCKSYYINGIDVLDVLTKVWDSRLVTTLQSELVCWVFKVTRLDLFIYWKKHEDSCGSSHSLNVVAQPNLLAASLSTRNMSHCEHCSLSVYGKYSTLLWTCSVYHIAVHVTLTECPLLVVLFNIHS